MGRKKTFSQEEKARIYKRSQEIIAQFGSGVDLADLSEEDAMDVTLPSVGFDYMEAKFIVALEKGRLPNKVGDVYYLY
jgi:hypothetical protein